MNDRAENRHPADALADCRAQIKTLRETEERLRAQILADAGNRTGDEFDATVVEITVERIDGEALKRELGLAFMRPFMRQQTQRRILLDHKPKAKAKVERSRP